MTYPIKGIQKGLGPSNDPLREVPLRREIDEWWESSDPVDVNQRTLFILALDSFQKMDPETMLSYFQVAGALLSSGCSSCFLPVL
jgi:tyrosinase